jgi:hypothetical protein
MVKARHVVRVGRRERHAGLWWKNLKEKGNFEDIGNVSSSFIKRGEFLTCRGTVSFSPVLRGVT